MAAYLIAAVDVHDPNEYQEYTRANTETVRQHGGRFIARGGFVDHLEGEWVAPRMVIIEFPNLEAAEAWYHSPAYQAVVPVRQRHADTHLLAILDGVSPL
jgi:uncharacterized protein (DUF1330 family)